MPDTPRPDADRLPPGVPPTPPRRPAPATPQPEEPTPPSRASRRRAAAAATSSTPVGASRAATEYPTVDPMADAEADGDWRWDDGRYVRVTRPAPTWRKLLYTLVGLAVIIGAVGYLGLNWIRGQMDPPGPPGEVIALEVPSGSTTDDIATLLAEEEVVENPTLFRYYLRWRRIGEFQAGDYTLNRSMSFDEAIEVLQAGPAPVELDRFTVPEGLTVREIGERLEAQIDGFEASEMQSALIRMDTPWRPEDVDSWEGLLFPDTYDYEIGDSPTAILERMNSQFDAVARDVGLDPATIVHGSPTGLTAYDYIIIASMIEEESRVPEEYGQVSRVIHNRLFLQMPLGIDATVLYARGPEREGPLTDADLAIDSPYNTRLNPGMPPTPIAAPGRAALAAAMNPAEGDWLYYVLATEDGRHFFTDDYDEFIRQRDESRAQGLF